MPDLKTLRTRCLEVVLHYVSTKTFTSSHRNKDKFGPKLEFLAKHWPSLAIWSHAQPKKQSDKVPRWFSVKWVPKLLLPPKKLGFLVQKWLNLAQNFNFYPTISLSDPFGSMPDQ